MEKRKQLTDDIIYAIYNQSGRLSDIAKKFNVSPTTVRRIKNLTYDKYKKIIDKFEQEQIQKNKVKIQDAVETKLVRKRKEIKEADKVDNVDENVKNKIQEKMERMDKDVLVSDIVSLLEEYFTPIVIKAIFENVFKDEKFEALLKESANKIKELQDINFYAETVKTIFLGLLMQTIKEKYIPVLIKK